MAKGRGRQRLQGRGSGAFLERDRSTGPQRSKWANPVARLSIDKRGPPMHVTCNGAARMLGKKCTYGCLTGKKGAVCPGWDLLNAH